MKKLGRFWCFFALINYAKNNFIIIWAFVDYQKQNRQKAEGTFTLHCVIYLSITNNKIKIKADLQIISKNFQEFGLSGIRKSVNLSYGKKGGRTIGPLTILSFQHLLGCPGNTTSSAQWWQHSHAGLRLDYLLWNPFPWHMPVYNLIQCPELPGSSIIE